MVGVCQITHYTYEEMFRNWYRGNFFFAFCCFCIKILFIFLFIGFGDRLLTEVKKLAPKDLRIRVSQLPLFFSDFQNVVKKSHFNYFLNFLFKPFVSILYGMKFDQLNHELSISVLIAWHDDNLGAYLYSRILGITSWEIL